MRIPRHRIQPNIYLTTAGRLKNTAE